MFLTGRQLGLSGLSALQTGLRVIKTQSERDAGKDGEGGKTLHVFSTCKCMPECTPERIVTDGQHAAAVSVVRVGMGATPEEDKKKVKEPVGSREEGKYYQKARGDNELFILIYTEKSHL